MKNLISFAKELCEFLEISVLLVSFLALLSLVATVSFFVAVFYPLKALLLFVVIYVAFKLISIIGKE